MEDERQKQEAGIPENAFRELKPGEEYIPVMRPRPSVSGSDSLLCDNGSCDGDYLQCRGGISRTESGAGV